MRVEADYAAAAITRFTVIGCQRHSGKYGRKHDRAALGQQPWLFRQLQKGAVICQLDASAVC